MFTNPMAGRGDSHCRAAGVVVTVDTGEAMEAMEAMEPMEPTATAWGSGATPRGIGIPSTVLCHVGWEHYFQKKKTHR